MPSFSVRYIGSGLHECKPLRGAGGSSCLSPDLFASVPKGDPGRMRRSLRGGFRGSMKVRGESRVKGHLRMDEVTAQRSCCRTGRSYLRADQRLRLRWQPRCHPVPRSTRHVLGREKKDRYCIITLSMAFSTCDDLVTTMGSMIRKSGCLNAGCKQQISVGGAGRIGN